MVRWTLTSRHGKTNGYESNAIMAYKKAVANAQECDGGAIITVDDTETDNSIFHTEHVSEVRAHAGA